MGSFSLLLILVLLNIVYIIGFLGAQALRKSRQHYFLGFNPGFLTISFREVKLTLGVYIPIIGLARIYCVDNSGRKHLFYPWQFSSTSVSKRLLLTYSGVLAMFVFGIILSTIAVYISKDQYIPKDEVIKYGIYPSHQAQTVGFLPGDKVIALNGKDYSDFAELVRPETILSEQTTYTVLRQGKELVLALPDVSKQSLQQHELFLTINSPFSVGNVLPESPAEKAGILSGDLILKVNGQSIKSFQEMNSHFESDDDGEVLLEIQRGNNSEQKLERIVTLSPPKKIGISINQMIEYKVRSYSFSESFKLGFPRFWSSIVVQFKIFGRMFGLLIGEERRTLSGPIGISAAFGSLNFSWFLSFTSIYIAFVISLNFLPLPKSALLEVMPLAYEAVKRKPLSYKSFRMIRRISIVLLSALITWQLFSDIIKLL